MGVEIIFLYQNNRIIALLHWAIVFMEDLQLRQPKCICIQLFPSPAISSTGVICFISGCMSACMFSPLSCKEDITHSPLHLAHFLPMPLTATYQIPTVWYVVSLHVLLQACASLQVFYSHVYQ